MGRGGDDHHVRGGAIEAVGLLETTDRPERSPEIDLRPDTAA